VTVQKYGKEIKTCHDRDEIFLFLLPVYASSEIPSSTFAVSSIQTFSHVSCSRRWWLLLTFGEIPLQKAVCVSLL
jgi:hypothetical protein